MVKLIFCLRRREDVSEEEFHRYWLEEHGPLVAGYAELFGIRRYVQVHAAHNEVAGAIAATRGAPEPFDGVAELWFDSTDALIAATSSDAGQEAGQRLLEDERRFIDHARSPLFLAEEHAIIA